MSRRPVALAGVLLCFPVLAGEVRKQPADPLVEGSFLAGRGVLTAAELDVVLPAVKGPAGPRS